LGADEPGEFAVWLYTSSSVTSAVCLTAQYVPSVVANVGMEFMTAKTITYHNTGVPLELK